MLFDPKWNVLHPELRELRELHDFLASKDPQESYDWSSIDSCAFAQFRRLSDCVLVTGRTRAYTHIGRGPDPFPRTSHWTFGQALERCREVIANPRRYRVQS